MSLRGRNRWCLVAILIFICFLGDVSGEIYVNEIMADCGTRTENCEWIELNIDELKSIVIDTTGQKTEINFSKTNISTGLIIITKSLEAFLKNWDDDEKNVIEWKGMGLVNTGDAIKLMFGDETIDNVAYSSSNKNKSWQKIGNEWKECLPTPLLENACNAEQEDNKDDTNDKEQEGNEANNTPEEQNNIELKLVFESEIKNNDEINIDLIANNLKDQHYDIKIALEKEDSVFSEVYNENTGDWSDSYYYLDSYIKGPGDKIEQFEMRLKDEDFTGRLHIVAKLRSKGVIVAEYRDVIDVVKGDDKDTNNDKDNEEQIIVNAATKPSNEGKIERNKETVKNIDEEIIRLNSPKTEKNINSNVVWMSTNEKIKKYALYGFALFCFFALLYFVVKRWLLKRY